MKTLSGILLSISIGFVWMPMANCCSKSKKVDPCDGKYFLENRTCVPFDPNDDQFKGPCGENMILKLQTPDAERKVKCFCDDLSYKPMYLHEETQNCFILFTQGPCIDKFWLTADEDDVIDCTENGCLNEPGYDEQLTVLFNKTSCVRVGSDCGENHQYRFNDNYDVECVRATSHQMQLTRFGKPKIFRNPKTNWKKMYKN